MAPRTRGKNGSGDGLRQIFRTELASASLPDLAPLARGTFARRCSEARKRSGELTAIYRILPSESTRRPTPTRLCASKPPSRRGRSGSIHSWPIDGKSRRSWTIKRASLEWQTELPKHFEALRRDRAKAQLVMDAQHEQLKHWVAESDRLKAKIEQLKTQIKDQKAILSAAKKRAGKADAVFTS